MFIRKESKQWQSLDQLCKDMLALSFKLEDSVRLASLLVSQLELVVTSTTNGSLQLQLEETSLLPNAEEE